MLSTQCFVPYQRQGTYAFSLEPDPPFISLFACATLSLSCSHSPSSSLCCVGAKHTHAEYLKHCYYLFIVITGRGEKAARE